MILRDTLLWIMTSRLVFPFTFFLISCINKIDDSFIDKFLSTKQRLEDDIPKRYLFRYTDLQAEIGIEQLKMLDTGNKARIRNARYYLEKLGNIRGIILPKSIPNTKSIFLNFPVRIKNRYAFIKELFRNGIDTTVGNLPVCSELGMFKKYKKPCPEAASIIKEIVYLPIQPDLTEEEISHIVNTIVRVQNKN